MRLAVCSTIGRMGWNKTGFQFSLWLYVVAQSLLVVGRSLYDQRDFWLSGKTHDIQQSPAAVKHNNRTTIGRYIVEKSFNRSFSGMVEYCADLPEMEGKLKYFTFLKCLEKFHKHRQLANYTSIRKKVPWWFDTMIRDSRFHGLHGIWHLLFFPDPALRMCVVEKAGTKQWRQVHCLANNATPEVSGCIPYFETRKDISQHAVFLRDPLDRFLSGFLDRCTTIPEDKHCEPLSVFMDPKTTLTGDFVGKDSRKLFEIFVEAMPLKWNFHFFPQSFYCGGLYRYIQDYDFVGSMATDFYSEIRRFVDVYPSYENPVREIFPVLNITTNVGTETRAAEKVRQYYTPRTLRRVLEYMSIDYVMLNLTIPAWAEEMLAEEQRELQ